MKRSILVVRRFFIAVLVVAVVVAARLLLLLVVVWPHPIPMGSSSSSSTGSGACRHHPAPVEDELAFLVALCLFDGGQVLPAQDGSAGDAEDVAHGVHPRRHHPVVLVADVHVRHLAEQVRIAVLAAEHLFLFLTRQSSINKDTIYIYIYIYIYMRSDRIKRSMGRPRK
ncbi:hypothetical protein C2845_PM05G00080 [Panicum miliaceum]|uniref:Uncharacterized protein n=1 Tax=Panicum miliaceum TaxID=4540 RepID=A0A3L6SUT1_PANMI|nr:hypothetical protein C2845_PM05G00080 [Panicum miliaceum]